MVYIPVCNVCLWKLVFTRTYLRESTSTNVSRPYQVTRGCKVSALPTLSMDAAIPATMGERLEPLRTHLNHLHNQSASYSPMGRSVPREGNISSRLPEKQDSSFFFFLSEEHF